MPTVAPLKVLLVDDNAIQLTMLRHLFQHARHEVMEAKNGAEALICLAHQMPDLVVSDCLMPLVDGYQLCRLLKDDRATRHLPVILLTAQGGQLSRFWARTCGADRFLVKGRDLHQLVPQAERLVEQTARPRATGLQLAVARENFSVEAIQRHLSKALEQRLLESAMRNAVGRLYGADLEARHLVSGFLEILQELVLPGAVLVLVDDPEGSWGLGVHGPAATPEQLAELNAMAKRALGISAEPAVDWSLGEAPEERGALHQPHLICLQTTLRGRPCLGAVALLVDWPHYIEQERLFDIATEELGRILALERSHQLLYQQAIRDPLTGLYNRRHMTELLRSEMEEARRFRQPLSLLALDLDRFKEINDRFGHGTGDQVLVIAAQRMAFGLRKVDRLARIGGEEFLVLCPRTDLDGAALLAERIRESIAEGPVPGLPEEQRITVSLGVATLKEGESAEAFIDRADRRLYEAKAQGRNRVVSTTEG